ncbi:glycosyl transferase family 1 [Corynebacterium stationis]|uniref:glycosyltransferase n=1 Tax=Corynebacterium stationis TaxID=1705 RepID=UPI0009504C22|nr:glycosyltransferase [Corynebacterium stationis]APT94562.1 glycosyl transferase family 1 [Corynebacterium stationis]
MHADEYRDYQQIRELRIAETLSGPEHVYNKLESLAGPGKDAYVRQLETERDVLKRRVRSAHATLDELKSENAQLASEKDLAERRLNSVRVSRTFQVGKLAVMPVQAARKVVTNPKSSFRQLSSSLKSSLLSMRTKLIEEKNQIQAKAKESRGWGTELSPQKSSADGTRGNGKHSADQGLKVAPAENEVAPKNSTASGSTVHRNPLEQFQKKQSVRNFERALNFLWFTEGKIAETQSLINKYPKLVDKLSEVPKSLASRVLGEARLLELDLVPIRSQFPAYVAEPNRVMYCIHQSPLYNSNGYSTRSRGVANGIKASGGDVVVVARSGYPWDSKADTEKPKPTRVEATLDGIQYVHIPGGNLNRDPIDHYTLQCADAFVREARMVRPSVIQAASNFRTALPALIAARRLGIPFVYEVRGLWEFTEAAAKPGFENTERFAAMRELENLVAQNADHILAITSQVKDELVARGANAENITVAPNSVDPEVFVPLPKDTNYAKSKKIRVDVPVVGFAGSIVGYEGLDDLVDASAILKNSGVDHQIVIAGSGAAENALKERVAKLKLEQQVTFLGRLPQNEMPRLQSIFDIVACPRKSNLVTELVSPLKPLESFATGKATVLSNVSPNKDLAGEDEGRALLSVADSAESLSSKLKSLILDSDLRADLGRTGRLWIVTERSWEKLGEKILTAHIQAAEAYERNTPESKLLSSLRVGVIGDEFTRSTLEDAFDVQLLSRTSWRDQLSADPKLDMVFVESAWEGNEAEWHRGVGHYSDEESADLRGMLTLARERGIPTVFWNKEDPIHISRFVPNAALFDHVFTTDANMIPRYLKEAGCKNKTVSALPFYAQPKLHNPLPSSREFKKSIAYAGSYYGDRYKERSKGLERLLESSAKYDMDIYDRQANNPDSPYKFPEAYRSAVRGGLLYRDVIESYKSHTAHLNVNSVLNSPTMFSRRVVEIPACGGIVLSAYGRGIAETLGSNIAHSNNAKDHRAWLYDWSSNPSGRLDEIWRQMRTVYRAHTTESALSILARTAGISVQGLQPRKYIAVLTEIATLSERERAALINRVVTQSVRPSAVIALGLTQDEKVLIEQLGIEASADLQADEELGIEVYFPNEFSRTFAEDVMLPLRFGDYGRILTRDPNTFGLKDYVTTVVDSEAAKNFTLAVRSRSNDESQSITVTLPMSHEIDAAEEDSEEESFDFSGKTVLVAGHDLKFAGAILDELYATGCEVLIDKWEGHNKHDPAKSKELLNQADIVVCEWGLGNAVWYSNNLLSRQSMIVRVHSQELFLPFLSKVNKANVSKFIFVGELIRKAAITSHGVPSNKTVVIPNFVDSSALNRSKLDGAEKTLGMVGIVPRSKRLDRALDILEGLLKHDPGYKLRIKGKTPEDYPWMKNRPQEMEFYSEQNSRIDSINSRYPDAVVFDGYGSDMEEWYRKVGIVLSTSDFESFHLTLADGAASGALPVSLDWPGADLIYPTSWLSGTTDGIVSSIIDAQVDTAEAQQFVKDSFERTLLLRQFMQILGNSRE